MTFFLYAFNVPLKFKQVSRSLEAVIHSERNFSRHTAINQPGNQLVHAITPFLCIMTKEKPGHEIVTGYL